MGALRGARLPHHAPGGLAAHERGRHRADDVPAAPAAATPCAAAADAGGADLRTCLRRPSARVRERPPRARALVGSHDATAWIASAACVTCSTASRSSSSRTWTGRPAGRAGPSPPSTPRSSTTARSCSCPRGRCSPRPSTSSSTPARGAGAATASHPRVLVVAGRASQVTVIESYGGAEGPTSTSRTPSRRSSWRTGRSSITTASSARAPRPSTSATLAVRQGRASRFSSHAIALGAALSRVDIRQVFAGEGGECVLNGLFLAGDSQHTDTHTWVDHAQPHCSTRELYKGIVDDQAHGVFVGNILRARGRPEDGRHPEQQEPDPLPGRAGGQRAPARDPGRRRQVQARVDDRPARSAGPLLPALARHRRGSGARPAHLRLRQRRRAAARAWKRCAPASPSTCSGACPAPRTSRRRSV